MRRVVSFAQQQFPEKKSYNEMKTIVHILLPIRVNSMRDVSRVSTR